MDISTRLRMGRAARTMTAATFAAFVACCGFTGWCAYRFVMIREAERLRTDVRRRLVQLGWIQ